MLPSMVVGISDCKISNESGMLITTYALGSCVGVALYDLDSSVGGLLHVLLPNSIAALGDREPNPYMFADTGIIKMIEGMIALGANPQKLTARIAGGANMLSSSSVLDVGKKNVHAVMESLERLKIPIRGSSVGGTLGRSMEIYVGSGKVVVKYLGGGEIAL